MVSVVVLAELSLGKSVTTAADYSQPVLPWSGWAPQPVEQVQGLEPLPMLDVRGGFRGPEDEGGLGSGGIWETQ